MTVLANKPVQFGQPGMPLGQLLGGTITPQAVLSNPVPEKKPLPIGQLLAGQIDVNKLVNEPLPTPQPKGPDYSYLSPEDKAAWDTRDQDTSGLSPMAQKAKRSQLARIQALVAAHEGKDKSIYNPNAGENIAKAGQSVADTLGKYIQPAELEEAVPELWTSEEKPEETPDPIKTETITTVHDVMEPESASGWMGGYASDPETAGKQLQNAAYKMAYNESTPGTPEEKEAWYKDKRLWAGLTGLLTAAAGGASLEEALLYSMVGAQAGAEELTRQEGVQSEADKAAESKRLADRKDQRETVDVETRRMDAENKARQTAQAIKKSKFYMGLKKQEKTLWDKAHAEIMAEQKLEIDGSGFGDMELSPEETFERVLERYNMKKTGKVKTTETKGVIDDAYVKGNLERVKERYAAASDEQKEFFRKNTKISEANMRLVTGD